jgi:hypothetical protein
VEVDVFELGSGGYHPNTGKALVGNNSATAASNAPDTALKDGLVRM